MEGGVLHWSKTEVRRKYIKVVLMNLLVNINPQFVESRGKFTPHAEMNDDENVHHSTFQS